jgi:hypothetical protein
MTHKRKPKKPIVTAAEPVPAPPAEAAPASSVNPEQPETHEAKCSATCGRLLEQVEATYYPAHRKPVDVFVTLALQEPAAFQRARVFADPIHAEVNTLFQSVACWGLSRMRFAEHPLALRQLGLFLEHLEDAASHLEKGMQIDSTMLHALRGDAIFAKSDSVTSFEPRVNKK